MPSLCPLPLHCSCAFCDLPPVYAGLPIRVPVALVLRAQGTCLRCPRLVLHSQVISLMSLPGKQKLAELSFEAGGLVAQHELAIRTFHFVP